MSASDTDNGAALSVEPPKAPPAGSRTCATGRNYDRQRTENPRRTERGQDDAERKRHGSDRTLSTSAPDDGDRTVSTDEVPGTPRGPDLSRPDRRGDDRTDTTDDSRSSDPGPTRIPAPDTAATGRDQPDIDEEDSSTEHEPPEL